jgi:hypothetical protein
MSISLICWPQLFDGVRGWVRDAIAVKGWKTYEKFLKFFEIFTLRNFSILVS